MASVLIVALYLTAVVGMARGAARLSRGAATAWPPWFGVSPSGGAAVMTKLVALIALIALSTIASVGNYWFTFGLWPRSWGSLVVFSIISLAISLMLRAVLQDDDV